MKQVWHFMWDIANTESSRSEECANVWMNNNDISHIDFLSFQCRGYTLQCKYQGPFRAYWYTYNDWMKHHIYAPYWSAKCKRNEGVAECNIHLTQRLISWDMAVKSISDISQKYWWIWNVFLVLCIKVHLCKLSASKEVLKQVYQNSIFECFSSKYH